MKRTVQSELLDTLPPADPRARHSRRDLRRVNAWMGNAAIMAQALSANLNGPGTSSVTEIGAGDGHFLLAVAKKLPPAGTGRTAVLLDRQNTVTPETVTVFSRLGWSARVVVRDAFDWMPGRGETVIANLFLHHFEAALLVDLFSVIARRASLFVAIEPRRAAWPLLCSRLLWAIGCNGVTRHDAVVSVRAGFAGRELSSLWPDKTNWHLTEQSAGPFSHLFTARRITE